MNHRNAMTRHFAAYRARMAAAAADGSLAGYEKREDAPEMRQIANMLTRLGGAFEEFKGKQDETLGRLSSRLDRLETRFNRPGAMLPSSSESSEAKANERSLFDHATGRPLVVLGREDGLDGIRRKMRQHALNTRGDASAMEDEGGTLRDFLCAVANLRTSEFGKKALSVGTDSAGGFAVPQVLMPQMLNALIAQSSMLTAGTRLVPMDQTSVGAGKSFTVAAVQSVPTAAWRAEAGAIAESDPVFRAITLTPRSLAVRFKVSRELLADALSLDDTVLFRCIADAFAQALDLVGLRGSGSAPTPRGVLNIAGVGSVTNGAAGASLSTIRYSNILSAIQTILTANAPMPTAAIMHPRTLVGFASLADTTNQPLQAPKLVEPMLFAPTSQIPVNLTVGASTDCTELYVGDFTRAFWFVRESMSVLVDPYSASTTGEVQFIGHWRGDFAVEYAQAFAVVTGVRP